jgi:Zn-dependent protease
MPEMQQGPTLAGSFRLFRLAGITVYLHWSWLLIAYFELQVRKNSYQSPVWNVVEYVSVFLIVLLHEFGHALACRQVGGRADEIVLWPLGGIAFVKPPPRPGAVLWSIAAGPLVNLLLVPLTFGAWVLAAMQGLADVNRDLHHFLFAVAFINGVLLVFNLLPIYPLDGGQILQALLWFLIGRARSLFVVCIIGLIASVGIVAAAIYYQDWWFVVLAVFAASRCLVGFQQASVLARLEAMPRHADAVCPSCGEHPVSGDLWACNQCRARFDTFDERGVCPGCGQVFATTTCPECRQAHPIEQWFAAGGNSMPLVQRREADDGFA